MKIVVGYDGSDAANEALNVAKKNARAFDGRIYVITSLVGGTEESAEEIIKARSQLENAVKSIQKEGIPCENTSVIFTVKSKAS